MVNDLKAADKVGWDSSGGHSTGKVARRLAGPRQIKGHKVAASRDNPNIWSKPMTARTPPTSRRRCASGDDSAVLRAAPHGMVGDAMTSGHSHPSTSHERRQRRHILKLTNSARKSVDLHDFCEPKRRG